MPTSAIRAQEINNERLGSIDPGLSYFFSANLLRQQSRIHAMYNVLRVSSI